MKTTSFLAAAAAALITAACATTAPAPSAAPRGEERYLVDPRTGFQEAVAPAVDRKFEAAWRAFESGDSADARRRLTAIRASNPEYAPAALAEAAVDLREGNAPAARAIVDRVRARRPQYLAAQVYDAETALAEKQTRRAYDLYRQIASRSDAPKTANERLSELQTRLFEELFNAAIAAPPEQSVPLLRQALEINPGASAARILAVQRLIQQRRFEEASAELQPLLQTPDAERAEVQEALAEIDVSRGQFEDAIARYERLAHQTHDARYSARLEQVKEQFAEANMPPQFKRAIEDQAITRADLAVLMYWDVASVRFAQNVPVPPIATDIGETPGRDEIIRAIALGIFPVDPVTRRVNPFTPVTAAMLTRSAARLLAVRGAGCVRNAAPDATDLGRAQKILAACAVTDASLAGADLTVSGRTASVVMQQVDRALR